MPRYTIVTGLLLIFLGASGYLSYNTVTVLIPAFIGLLITLCGVLALKTERRRKFIHIAIVVVVIGLAGSITSLSTIPLLLSCEVVEGCDKLARQLAALYLSIIHI